MSKIITFNNKHILYDAATFDVDALAYYTAIGLNDSTIYYPSTIYERTGLQIKNYINTFVVSLKGYGLWTKMKAMYPFIGGSANSHKFNLKDPRDLDVAFRLTFSGGLTHSSTGCLPNGSTGYADTHLIPSTNLTVYNSHLSYYSRTESDGPVTDIISRTDGAGTIALYIKMFDNYTISDNMGRLGCYNIYTSKCFTIASRISNVSHKIYKNNNLVGTSVSASDSMPTTTTYLFGKLTGSSNRECAFASIGDGLTDTDALNLYNIVQQYETLLSRNN